jgi:UDP-2-acetamido-3-amino-2,3-dideoxy-glucuronate N-acetyltransferase
VVGLPPHDPPVAPPRVHSTAIVDETARLGEDTVVWSHACIGAGVVVGRGCRIGHAAYLDRGVRLGDRVVVHTSASVFRPFELGDDVFIGPHACLSNDRDPAATRIRDLGAVAWRVGTGATVGAGAIVLADVELAPHVLIGAGAVVTRATVAYGVYLGSPARLTGFRCACGARAPLPAAPAVCSACGRALSRDPDG